VIVGKALYEGRLTIAEAQAALDDSGRGPRDAAGEERHAL
jgi:hypothetical protein